MNKIRIKRNLYVIEVNDEGDTISIDMDDLDLPFKIEKLFIAATEEPAKLKAEIEKAMELSDDSEALISDKDRRALEVYKEFYKNMREKFDDVLGDGACQKIFGNSNYIDMFNDLVEQLSPHFKKMGVSRQKSFDRIKEKYSDSKGDTI